MIHRDGLISGRLLLQDTHTLINYIINLNLFIMKKLLSSLLVFFFVSANVSATNFYVVPGGTGGGSGWDQASALGSVATAVNWSAGLGDTVFVAAGTYNETVSIKDGTVVLGGYDPATGERDIEKNVTILDGTGLGDAGANKYVLVKYDPGCEHPTLIEGFTLQNGYHQYEGGGAIIRGNVILSKCIIKDCNTPSSGGAVYNVGGTIQDCYITNCKANYGAGVYNDGGIVKGSTIEFCAATSRAGGVYMNGGILENSILRGNGGKYGGAICNYANGVVRNCVIHNNEETVGSWPNSGGVYNPEGIVANCIIASNAGKQYAGIHSDKPVVNTITWNNQATDASHTAETNYASTSGGSLNNASDNGNDGAKSALVLNADNAAADGPQFVKPTTFAGFPETAEDTLAIREADFSFLPTSPCIDKGIVNENAPAYDLLGVERPQGAAYDLGAYEYKAEAPIKPVGPQLNIYASGLSSTLAEGQLTVKYTLNAEATEVSLLVLNGEETVATYPLTGLAKGANEATVDVSALAAGAYNWAIKAASEERTELSEDLLAGNHAYDFYQPRGLASDFNPESPFFGNIYMGNSKSGKPGAAITEDKTPTGVAIFDALLAQQGSIYGGGVTWEADGWGPGRIKVGEDGMVYVNDHAKTTAGVFKMDPANPSANFTPVLDLAQRGVTFALPVAMEIIGSGAERTLYTWNYIGVNDGQILKYAIGENDNYALAPDTFAVASFTGNQYAEIAADGRGGFWLTQNRGQIDGYHALAHMNNEGVIDYTAGDHTDIFTSPNGKASARGVVSLNKEKNLLAMAWDKTAAVFSIAYDETTGAPTLTKEYATNTIGTNVDAVCFDYAGNLYVGSASSERLHVFATPSANVTTTPAPKADVIAVGVMVGTYTVGGEGADFASLAEATTAVNTTPIVGDVTLAIAADLTETTNSGLVNTTEYTIKVTSATATQQVITFTSETKNAGPEGSLIIGSSDPVTGTNEVATKNVIIDNVALVHKNAASKGRLVIYGAADGIILSNLSSTLEYTGGTHEIETIKGASGAVPQNTIIRGCTITGKNTTWALCFRQANGAIIEDCIFDCEGQAEGAFGYTIMARTEFTGQGIFRNNRLIKFVETDTKGTGFLSLQGGNWIVENNYFGGMDYVGEGATRLVYIRPISGVGTIIRHNTFHVPAFTNKPGNTDNQNACIEGIPAAEIRNNIFVYDDPTARFNFYINAINTVENNVFYYDETNANAFINAGKKWAEYTAADANIWAEVHFTDAAAGDLSLTGASDGDINLAVPAIADVTTDITGKARHEGTVYAGAYEGIDFIVPQPTEMWLNPGWGEITAGGEMFEVTVNFDIEVSEEDLAANLKWSADREGVMVMGLNEAMIYVPADAEAGQLVVTATYGDLEAVGYYTIVPAGPQGITITPNEDLEIESLGTLQLTALLYPEDATNKVIWWSSDESLATVSETGLVTSLVTEQDTTVTINAKVEYFDEIKAYVEIKLLGAKQGTGLENADAEQVRVRKVFENGNVYIIREGVRYTISGIRIE